MHVTVTLTADGVQEATMLEEVAVQHSSAYDFVSPSNPTSRIFSDLFDALVRCHAWDWCARHMLIPCPWPCQDAQHHA